MRLTRCVQLEWLDVLDPDDPRASRSRRDLQRVNRVMGNDAILARALRKARSPGPRLIVELGAGDGTLLLRVMQRPTLRWQGGTIIFVDRQSLVSKSTREGATCWRPCRNGWPSAPAISGGAATC